MKRLLDAIRAAESQGDSTAVGDGGRAVGAYQLHAIYVADVNRIISRQPSAVSRQQYVMEDRLNEAKSRQMVRIYLRYYGQGRTLVEMARIHNGGPDGWRRKSTLAYAAKIERLLTTESTER